LTGKTRSILEASFPNRQKYCPELELIFARIISDGFPKLSKRL